MTPRELIKILMRHLDRRAVMFSLPDDPKAYDISEQLYLFRSNEDYARSDGRDTAPLLLMGEWEKPNDESL